ncbi:MAG: class I SAM-dependent methyltransferase [Planctomycetota bacterium]|nr:class I SAM-dependent methyltransferase [Planctomycetota bacterium]
MTEQSCTNPNQQLWEKGDFSAIAEAFMREPGAALVDSLGVTPQMRVLDLGCGDGTTALPLAQHGADVLGIDIARNLVDAGNARAQAAGLENLRFENGDASDLTDVADHAFDLTISIFGAMFCPKPFDVAREMVRVTQPGGRIVMGNWIPNDPTSFVSDVLKISSAFTPPPPEGFISPMLWGVETNVLERFGSAGIEADRISIEKDTFQFTSSSRGADDWVNIMKDYYGPTMNAYEAARASGNEAELHRQLTDLTHAHNLSSEDTLQIRATYLRVTVQV